MQPISLSQPYNPQASPVEAHQDAKFGMAFTQPEKLLADRVLDKLWLSHLYEGHVFKVQPNGEPDNALLILGYAGRLGEVIPSPKDITVNIQHVLRECTKITGDVPLGLTNFNDFKGRIEAYNSRKSDEDLLANIFFRMKGDIYENYSPLNLHQVAEKMGLDITG
jgi:hypothetical protein